MIRLSAQYPIKCENRGRRPRLSCERRRREITLLSKFIIRDSIVLDEEPTITLRLPPIRGQLTLL